MPLKWLPAFESETFATTLVPSLEPVVMSRYVVAFHEWFKEVTIQSNTALW
jgi:hypothetical protein